MAALLEARDVSFAYRGGEPVLHNVSFTVDEGANLGIVGESGAGKTTLLRILLGLSVPTSGEIFAEGRPFDARNRAQLRDFRRLTQTVFQDPYSSLDPRQSIGRIVAEPLEPSGSPAPTLMRFPGSKPRSNRSGCRPTRQHGIRTNSLADNGSASQSPAPSSRIPEFCSPTNPPARST